MRQASPGFLIPLLLALPSQQEGFEGLWSTSLGPMQLERLERLEQLERSGARVAGTYGWDDAAVLEGEQDGDRLEFEWRAANGSRGTGSFELWEDGDTFTGRLDLPRGEEQLVGAYRLRPRQAEARPGEVTRGQTTAMLNYHLRVPADYDPERSWTAIAFFHGSNMSARAYVDTIVAVWPELADRTILVGFDGERMSGASRPDRPMFNATYVNFEGEDDSYPAWKRNETPALVARSLDELSGFLPVERWLLGGHSQGGFLTYAVAMFYPEKIAGAFPMSCGLLVQCEPSYFTERPELVAAQHRVPIAIIHGKNDPVVGFSSGAHGFEALQDGGFPGLQLFSDPYAAHMFARLPVDLAVDWLEAMSSRDPDELVSFAEESLEVEEVRDACAAALRARELDARGDLTARIDAVLAAAEEQAAAAALQLERAMAADEVDGSDEAGRDGDWVDDFWEFRREFGLTLRARPVLDVYAELRAQHQPQAEELFRAARHESDAGKRAALYEELVRDAYASSYYKLVSRWLE